MIQGIQGIQGRQGIQGTRGFQGIQGATGSVGLSGSRGLQGIQGTTLQGTLGSSGGQGLQGVRGFQGVQGITGPGALSGNRGEAGIQGIRGGSAIPRYNVSQSITLSTDLSASVGAPNTATGYLTYSTTSKTYALVKIQVNAPVWMTFYVDNASRLGDVDRDQSEDPDANSGVVGEVVITSLTGETFNLTPPIIGFNNDTPPNGNIYAKVVNLGSNITTIQTTLTLLTLE